MSTRRKTRPNKLYFRVLFLYLLLNFLFVIASILVFFDYKNRFEVAENQTQSADDTPHKTFIEKIIETKNDDPYAKLTTDEKIALIYENSSTYPDWLIESFQKNETELCDYVLAYPDMEHKVYGGISKSEMELNDPLFKQWDKRWAYYDYGSSILGVTGCCPTVLSMAAFSITRNELITPDLVAKYAMENNYYVPGTGTMWKLVTAYPPTVGLTVTEMDQHAESEYKKVLDAGGKIILSMGPGEFADAGHFIEIYGYNNEGYLVNDPFYTYHSAEGISWPFHYFSEQAKSVWGITSNENPVVFYHEPIVYDTPVNPKLYNVYDAHLFYDEEGKTYYFIDNTTGTYYTPEELGIPTEEIYKYIQ